MVDIQTILQSHHSKGGNSSSAEKSSIKDDPIPTSSEIPDVFFDDILVNYKLSRGDTLVLMFLYRFVWCRPNLHRKYGIGPMMSYTELSTQLGITLDEVYQSLRKLEDFGFIETIRSGQYFVRRYFTPDNDHFFGQVYDDF